MLRSEVLRSMLNHQRNIRLANPLDDTPEGRAMANYEACKNSMLEAEIHRQQLAELQEAARASADNDNFSVNIRSEVKTK